MSGPGELPEPIFPWISPQVTDLFTRAQVEQVRDGAYAAGQADERAAVVAWLEAAVARSLAHYGDQYDPMADSAAAAALGIHHGCHRADVTP